jgi:hypothetical protein
MLHTSMLSWRAWKLYKVLKRGYGKCYNKKFGDLIQMET